MPTFSPQVANREVNILAEAAGSYDSALRAVFRVVECFSSGVAAQAFQVDAASQDVSSGKVVSTDPPYYDNIGYADLSDFFYVWLRRSLRPVLPGEALPLPTGSFLASHLAMQVRSVATL